MCDYSLHAMNTRQAEQGDILEVCKFAGTATMGLRRPQDNRCATCLKPGTEVVFATPVQRTVLSRFLSSLWPTKKPMDLSRTAKFVQVDVNNPTTHHDAFEFLDGTVLKVQQLSLRQRVKVLQVPAQPQSKPQPEVPFALSTDELVV